MTIQYSYKTDRIPQIAEPGEYSVALTYSDGSNWYVRRWVSAKEACKAFRVHIKTVAADIGMVKEVMITDSLDQCNMHWVYRQGIVFPTKEQVEAAKEAAQTQPNGD